MTRVGLEFRVGTRVGTRVGIRVGTRVGTRVGRVGTKWDRVFRLRAHPCSVTKNHQMGTMRETEAMQNMVSAHNHNDMPHTHTHTTRTHTQADNPYRAISYNTHTHT